MTHEWEQLEPAFFCL